nr:YtcA family lipoprotein [Chania multitudinisentens]
MSKATFFRWWRGAFFRCQGRSEQAQRRRSLMLLLVAFLSLSGCVNAKAPAFSLLGSYFPSWIACAVIGIVVAIIARVLFIRVGIDEVLPWRLFVYVCLALAMACLSSLLIFAR